jgi:hypothetical protein
MAAYTAPQPSRIDELLASRKQQSSRQRQLDAVATRILATKSAAIRESHQDDVMEKVAELLQQQKNPTLQKLFLLRGIKVGGARALSQALPHTKSLSVLKIMQNTNAPKPEEALQIVLKEGLPKSSITDLVLNYCPMEEVETVLALVHALTSSSTDTKIVRLSIVDVPSLGMHSSLVGKLFQAPKLQHVTLIRCGIDPACALAISTALKTNTTLEFLNLEGNPIGDEGSRSLAEALKYNQTLQHLLLCRNCGIGLDGAKAFGEMLPHNNSLKELDLSSNPDIPIRGKEALTQGLQQNVSLCSTGFRVTRRHPIRPTVVEQMTDSLNINTVRQQWNNVKKENRRGPLYGVAPSMATTASARHHPQSSHFSSSLMPYYLAKLSAKPAVLYLALQENGDLVLPYL